ncbi:dnajb6-a [Symbiodinium sp. CCMP2456]|nr:dnajb6-a [Symbiodinium sp. CCMP2456]
MATASPLQAGYPEAAKALCPVKQAQIALPSEVVEYRVLQRSLVKRPGSSPTGPKTVKLTRPVGSVMFTTGRTWTGPQGGEWVELDSFVEKPGWLLVQGPGFGIPGPLLQRVKPGEAPPLLLRVAKPVEIGCAREEEREMREIVVSPTANVRDAKEWIALIFGLSDPRRIIVGKPTDARTRAAVTGAGFHIKSCDGLLDDETSIADAGFSDGDELCYVYTGDLEKSYEGKEPEWVGKLGVAPKPKAAKLPNSQRTDEIPELSVHFEVLQLAPSTARDQIKRQYRLLALECHPDKHPDDAEAATRRFQEVKSAFEAIRDALHL